jgi:chaperonin GroEL (HSP60 family)
MIHDAGNRDYGLNLFSAGIEDNMENGIVEPLQVKTQAISSASEVAIMILRIDDVIAAKASKGNGLKGGSGMMGYE